jgi:hypothetical protein
MYDKPNLAQLFDALRLYLESAVTPAVQDDRKLYYQTQVAINVLDIIERELEMEADHLKMEWKRLNFVQNNVLPMPSDIAELRGALAERNRKLCEEIGAGRYDHEPQRSALFEHLLVSAHSQLEVANPQYLQSLAAENMNKGG